MVWSASTQAGANGIAWTQVYAVMSGAGGRSFLATWNHFDYGKQRPPSDTVFRFDIDPKSGLERTVELTQEEPKLKAEAEDMELRLCRGQDAVEGLARGQDSPLCLQMMKEHPLRKLVTTPPANNRGRSVVGRH
jgi:hypothetical protein